MKLYFHVPLKKFQYAYGFNKEIECCVCMVATCAWHSRDSVPWYNMEILAFINALLALSEGIHQPVVASSKVTLW